MILTIISVFLFLFLMLKLNHSEQPLAKNIPTGEQIAILKKYEIDRKIKSPETISSLTCVKIPDIPAQQKWNTPPVISEKAVSCEMAYKNIAKTDTPLWWFECPHPDLPLPSPAEALIIKQLSRYNCIWSREISFYGLQVNKGTYPRFDFIIETNTRIGIMLIEYDGAQYHNSDHTRAMDKLKTLFCKEHSIPLHRLGREHYYHMEETIAKILSPYKIPLR